MIKATPEAAAKEFAVVDVRSDDFVGGNIVDCVNSPAETFHVDVDGLVKKLDGVPKVIFHCALSQQRGPKSARQKKAQEVYVLRDGFTGFQQKFRNDPALVEKFNKKYHD
ncbi:uncharacterized protein MKK02DRAFT_42348 [Dioszegia hungarica]|uniref:Rhodanese domain-containing protein n=1 Tax=Dioszegia hungarica TaxID=4972 RepID=A0AA38HAU5_9TREE|nr:uncharacterized protein MKK02DRAFT_42348 [Dioszegia hungarica]KAI9637967.1 hypothetical protein MKK02DRAFT_42348 [Dioszegia hungarica]